MINYDLNSDILMEKVKNPNRDVAIVIIKNSINEILLVRTKKLPNHWQPIGGGINKNEKPEEAAIRELYEETGLKIQVSDLVKSIEAPYDFGSGTVFCYYCNKKIMKNEIMINNLEIEEYQWFQLNDAMMMPMFDATKSFLSNLYYSNIN